MILLGGVRKGGGSKGAPVWMVTFADLMALLLAFFVLLFTFSELDKQLYKQIAGSMRDALGVQTKKRVKEPPKGVSLIAREFSPGKPQPTPVEQMRQSRADDTKTKVLMPEGGDPDSEAKSEAQQKKDRLQAEAERIKASLAEEIEKGSVEVEVSDQRIIVRILEQDAFPSGSDQPMIELDNVLQKMGTVLNSSGGYVIVSGHTDDVPIRNERFRSNWELSAARAVSVVHTLMAETGLGAERFMVEGAAETKPIDSNDTAEGRARNRRVEVTLVYAEDKELDKETLDRDQTGEETGTDVPVADPVTPQRPPATLPDTGQVTELIIAPVSEQITLLVTEAVAEPVTEQITGPAIEPLPNTVSEMPAALGSDITLETEVEPVQQGMSVPEEASEPVIEPEE